MSTSRCWKICITPPKRIRSLAVVFTLLPIISMIIAQVCLRLATIKGHSKMCSFITQRNATDVANFKGACNWHADCRNVLQSCWPWIECSFLYHKLSPKAFQRIWQYIQPAAQPESTCNHTSPGPPHPASSPPRSSETSHPDSCCNNRFT